MPICNIRKMVSDDGEVTSFDGPKVTSTPYDQGVKDVCTKVDLHASYIHDTPDGKGGNSLQNKGKINKTENLPQIPMLVVTQHGDERTDNQTSKQDDGPDLKNLSRSHTG